jgi:hypothetical protein
MHVRSVLAGLLIVAVPALALAGKHGAKHGGAAPLPPQYVAECGSCHVPFAPRLLPAASWRELMGALSRHFGTDASLDPPAASAIGAWLESNAGRSRKTASAPDGNRITRSAWFVHEHEKVASEAWRRPSVKSPSNC